MLKDVTADSATLLHSDQNQAIAPACTSKMTKISWWQGGIFPSLDQICLSSWFLRYQGKALFSIKHPWRHHVDLIKDK